MDVTQSLIAQPDEPARADGRVCPDCGRPGSGPAPVEVPILRGQPVRRCGRCGLRHTVEREQSRRLLHCDECGLPFLEDPLLDGPAGRCAGCRSANGGPQPAGPDVASATERELRAALRSEWNFVSAPSLDAYLTRLVRQLQPLLAQGLDDVRVAVFDESRHRTLALPSGTLLFSLGTLDALEDEAELAFVLAHELAHVSSTGAARRLTRLGLHTVATGGPDGSWSRSAEVMIQLGHGDKREHEADARAFAAVAELGYDLDSVRRYLGRLTSMHEAADPRVAELIVAHPLASARLRRLESFAVAQKRGRRATRTNREVFRRAAGRTVLDATLTPVEGLADRNGPRATATAEASSFPALRWWLLAALLAVAGFAGWYLLGS